MGGVLGKEKQARSELLSGSGVRGALQAIRDFILGYRKLTDDVKESLDTRLLFADRPGELPRDLERQGTFWFGELSQPASSYTWDPNRLAGDLSSEDPEVRDCARAAAIRHGSAGLLPLLTPLLASERPSVRSAVLEVIGSWRDPRALPLLTARLAEEADPATRVRAVLALKEIDDERVLEPLLAATVDSEKMVRIWAGAALKEWLPRLGRDDLRERVQAALARLHARPGTAPRADRAAKPVAPDQADVDL
jgi:hypothetical protein